MAGPYYVEPAVGNDSNAGTSWGAGNAWATLQKAVDTVAAGETVYCRGTESISAAIDFDGTDGTVASRINIIGCNEAGDDDGTYYTIAAGSSTCHGINAAGQDFITLKNIELTSSAAGAYNGIDVSSISSNWILDNCKIDGFPTNGIDGSSYLYYAYFYRLVVVNCGNHGVNGLSASARINFCRIMDNGGSGVVSSYAVSVYGTVISGNTNWGIYSGDGGSVLYNCVLDNNGEDGFHCTDAGVADEPNDFIGCRFTNNTSDGVSSAGARIMLVGCYFGGNGTDINGANIQDFKLNTTGGSDTDQGYLDPTNNLFNLRNDATLRSQEIQLP